MDVDTSNNSATETDTVIRQFFAVQQNGELTITGSNGDDVILIQQLAGNAINVVVNGVDLGTFASGVEAVTVNGLPGNDRIVLVNRVDVPIAIDGGTGTDIFDATNVADLLTTVVGSNPGTPSTFKNVEVLDVGNVVFLHDAQLDGQIDPNGGILDFSRLDYPIVADLLLGVINDTLRVQDVGGIIAPLFKDNAIMPESASIIVTDDGSEGLPQVGASSESGSSSLALSLEFDAAETESDRRFLGGSGVAATESAAETSHDGSSSSDASGDGEQDLDPESVDLVLEEV
jgi:hypothetical protein